MMYLIFNMLSRCVIVFLPRSRCLLISWLQSPSAVILEPPPQIKSATVSIVSPSICHETMGLDAMILDFWMLSFKQAFSLSSIGVYFLFTFCHWDSIICISEVTDISPRNLIPACYSSSLVFCMMWFIQPVHIGNISMWVSDKECICSARD